MRKMTSIAVSYLFLLASMSGPAWATSGAHFFSATSSVATTGGDVGDLVVNFDEAGLGNISGEVSYALTADGSATYACINGGNNHPKAANKENDNGPVLGTGSFTPTNNGRVIASLTAAPPPSNLTCPSGQKFVLASVSYTNIVLKDTTNNVTINVSSISQTFVNL